MTTPKLWHWWVVKAQVKPHYCIRLANHYGASYGLEMGRLFVQTDLGGTELGMQYDDYPLMATDHEQAIRAAKRFAPLPQSLWWIRIL